MTAAIATCIRGAWSWPGDRIARTLRLVAVAALAGLSAQAGPASHELVSTNLVAAQSTARSSGAGVDRSAVGELHGDLPYVAPKPLDWATARQLAAELVRAQAVALQYPTVADAKRAGYIEATGYTPGVGAHFMKFSAITGTFDIDHPAMILYNGVRPDARVVGLSYYVISGSRPPDGFAGPNDIWHQHPGVCVTPSGPVLAGDASQTCRLGGRPAWMLHAWVAPSYASPQGTFSPENVTLGGPAIGLFQVLRCQIRT